MKEIAIIFVVFVTIVLPLLFCIVAIVKKKKFPLVLGILAFVVSQMLLRIPLLSLLLKELPAFSLLQVTQPILYLILLSFSAGLFEEGARWLAMTFFLKKNKFASAIYFGLGHGGIEAVLIVALPVLTQLSLMNEMDLMISGLERILAMWLHVLLSIIVYYSVRMGKPSFLALAIVLHGLVNLTIVLLASSLSIYAAEGVFIVWAVLLTWLAINLKRRVINYENQA